MFSIGPRPEENSRKRKLNYEGMYLFSKFSHHFHKLGLKGSGLP